MVLAHYPWTASGLAAGDHVCSIYETWGIYHTYAERPRGTLIALIGSSGRLELAIVGDNAAERLGIQVGTPVIVAWE